MRPARTTGTSCTVTGLVPGTTYTFTVVANNAHQGWMGTGEGAGAESSTLVPTRSGAPESPRVRPGDRTLTISWDPPVNQGGTSVSGVRRQHQRRPELAPGAHGPGRMAG